MAHLAPVAVVYDGGGVYFGGGSSNADTVVSGAGVVAVAVITGGTEVAEFVGELGVSVVF